MLAGGLSHDRKKGVEEQIKTPDELHVTLRLKNLKRLAPHPKLL